MDGPVIIAILITVIGISLILVGFIFAEKYAHKEFEKSDEVLKAADIVAQINEEEIKRATNEKMEAITEYYNFVIEEIEKKHKELLFLYHMLGEKETNVNYSVDEVKDILKEVIVEQEKLRTAIKNIKITAKQKSITEENNNELNSKADRVIITDIIEKDNTEKSSRTEKFEKEKNIENNELFSVANILQPNAVISDAKEEKKKDEKLKEEKKKEEKIKEEKAIEKANVQKKEEKVTVDDNSNEKILALYAQGESVTDIAKELGLGTGEVKLVIDLFREVGL